MKRFHAIALPATVVFALLATSVLAPHAMGVQSDGVQQTESPAMMKSEDAHALLAQIVGIWNMQGQSIGPDGQVEFTLQGRCVWQWAMGGVFLFGDTLLSNGGAVMQEIDCLAFNAAAGTFQRTLMTDRDTATIWQQGTWDDTSKVFTMQSIGAIQTAAGTKRQFTTVVNLEQKDRMAWTTSYFEAGQLVGTIRMVCSRTVQGEGSAAMIPGLPTNAPTTANGNLDANALQGQLNQMVASKQQLQGQIDDWKKRVKASQDSMNQLTSP